MIQRTTLLLLIKDNKILLAKKKRGFGKEYLNGPGGKIEIGETPKKAAIRETEEEINVTPKNLKKVALNDFFFFEAKRPWTQRVFVYISDKWIGTPKETEEMKPFWFDISQIPYNKMWADDIFWLPEVLKGKKLKTKFWFNNNNQVVKHKIQYID